MKGGDVSLVQHFKDKKQQRVYTYLQLSAFRNGWSERYVDLLFQLILCDFSDCERFVDLLEQLNEEADKCGFRKNR